MAYPESGPEGHALVAALAFGSLDGRRAATPRSSFAGRHPTVHQCNGLRASSSRCSPPSSFRKTRPPPHRSCSKRAVSLSFLRPSPIRSAAALSPAWPPKVLKSGQIRHTFQRVFSKSIRPREFARHSRGLRRRWRVSVAGFPCFKEAFVEIGALVSGLEFSISVSLSQRLSSNSPETGLA